MAFSGNSDSKREAIVQQLPTWVQGCFSDLPAVQFESVQRLRKTSSIQHNPPIQQIVDSG